MAKRVVGRIERKAFSGLMEVITAAACFIASLFFLFYNQLVSLLFSVVAVFLANKAKNTSFVIFAYVILFLSAIVAVLSAILGAMSQMGNLTNILKFFQNRTTEVLNTSR